MDDSQHHQEFAARRPAGTAYPVTLTKDGVRHSQRMPDGSTREIIACGLACSECFSGNNLYRILKSGFDYEQQVMMQLQESQPAAPLSIHTSSGVSAALEDFIQALKMHLPWKKQSPEALDWCVSLQLEGASAVMAAVDMVLQVSMFENPSAKDRIKVAVGATSYHGPPSTSFGAKEPLWTKHNQLIYPVPTAYGKYDETELLAKYQDFLDKHSHEIGVMLVEPQWGSSQAALPWPEHLVKTYVRLARERGIKIVCDEIMCGLGRHGKDTLFISEAWDLDPDAVTFGKAIATGVFPLSGAILKRGKSILRENKCSVLQSHTYAGSSTRSLMAGTAVLKEFVTWLPNVAKLGQEITTIIRGLETKSQGLFICHGQGLMWGGIVTHEGQCQDAEFRKKVVQTFKRNCDKNLVVPYHVPVGGFMISPVIDIDLETIREIFKRLEAAIADTMEEVGWVAVVEEPIGGHIRVPSIASASALDLSTLARVGPIDPKTSGLQVEQDLGYDKLVPQLHAKTKRGPQFLNQ